jgi:hypothetical protein
MLPDGRVATSFMDERTKMPFPTTGISIVAPGTAIEMQTLAAETTASPAAPAAVLPNTKGDRNGTAALAVAAFGLALLGASVLLLRNARA